MRALSFLIICLVVLNNTVSTSKDGQSSINRKEDLSTSDEPRKLQAKNYIEVYYSNNFESINYNGFADHCENCYENPSRQSITSIIY